MEFTREALRQHMLETLQSMGFQFIISAHSYEVYYLDEYIASGRVEPRVRRGEGRNGYRQSANVRECLTIAISVAKRSKYYQQALVSA